MPRTGVYGGSFNPIHKGHIHIAETILQSGLVDELWLIVSPQNPFKIDDELLDDGLRLKLARIAVQNIPHADVSDIEYHLPRPSFTYNTLQELRKKHPERDFTLVIGADNWVSFPKWYKARTILQEFPVIIYPRKGSSIDETQLPPSVRYLSMPLYDVSSTDIRAKIKAGEDISPYLEEPVERELRAFLSRQQRRLKYPPFGR